MEGYKATIARASMELNAKEKIMYKNTTDCVSLDDATKDSPVLINVDGYVVLNIHNEKSDNKDYTKYIIIDKDGTRYQTGSESFWTAFLDIYEEMVDAGETDFKVKAFRMPSKNYAGRDFLTCSII